MNNKLFKIILIFLGFLSGPGILFLLPYIFNSKVYSEIAGVLVVAQSIMLVGTLGSEIYAAKNNIEFKKIFFNSFVICFLVCVGALFILSELNLSVFAAVFSYSLANVFSIITQQYLIINGLVRDYAIFGILKSLIFVSLFFILMKIDFDIYYSIALSSIFSFCVGFLFVRRGVLNIKYINDSFFNIIKNTIPYFFVNFSSVLPFVSEKVVAKNNFGYEDFSKYMVLSMWSLPFIYIANIYEKYSLSRNEEVDFKKIVLNIFLIGFLYLLFIYLLIFHFPFLKVPYFNDKDVFFSYFLIYFLWVLLYSLISFPISIFIQKNNFNGGLNAYSILVIIFVVIFFGFSLFLISIEDKYEFKNQFVFIYSFSIVTAFYRALLLVFFKNKSRI